MTVWHGDVHKRKKTGGRRTPHRGKRAFERGSPPTETRVGERKLKVVKGRGGVLKYRLFSGKTVNVVDPNTGKAEKAEIKKVLENRANREFQKRGVITKGALVETTIGKVKVTSRPGQHGVINGVLIERS